MESSHSRMLDLPGLASTSRWKTRVLLALVTMIALGGVAIATFGPIDPLETTVATGASNAFIGGGTVAKESDGSFVIAWRGNGQARARRYDAARLPLAADFRVDTDTFPLSFQATQVAVASDSQGAFVVVWPSPGTAVFVGATSVPHSKVMMQRYGSNGAAIGGATEVSGTLQAEVQNPTDNGVPAIAMTSGGAFVIAWKTILSTGASQIVARRYNASGVALDNPTVIATAGIQNCSFPSLATTSDGGYWIAWGDVIGGVAQIAAERHDANGAKVGSTLKMSNLFQPETALPPALAIGAGDKVLLAWRNFTHIAAGRFDSAGAPLGNDFQVDRSGGVMAGYQVALGADSDGRFIVAWTGTDTGGSADVKLRAFDIDGTPLDDAGGTTSDPSANTTVSGSQVAPFVGLGLSKDPVIAWSGFEGSGYILKLRGFDKLAPTGPPKPGPVSATPAVGNTTTIHVAWSAGSGGTTAAVSYQIKVVRDAVEVPALTTTVPVATTSVDLNVGTQGTYVFKVASVDSAGAQSSQTVSGNVVVDLTAPATTIAFAYFSHLDNGVTHVQASTAISLAASDALTGVSATYYRIDGGAQTAYAAAFVLPLGAHTVAYWSVDVAGNAETVHNASLVVDPAPLADGFAADGAEFTLSGITSLSALDSDQAQGGVIAWQSAPNVLWRRIDLAGALQGTQQSAASSFSLDAAASQSGRWVGVYQTYVSSHMRAITRALNSQGTQLTCESKNPLFTAPSFDTSSADRFPVIDAAADGAYVAVSPSFAYLMKVDPAPCDVTPVPLTFQASGAGNIIRADVAVHPDGRFVVAWVATVASPNGTEIFAQRFDKDGTALGSGFLVTDAAVAGDTNEVSVAYDLEGHFVVAWTQQTLNAFGNTDIRARVFGPDGTALGPSVLVTNAGPLPSAEFNQDPHVGADVGGNFVVTWTRADATQTDVYARAYNRNRVAVGPAVRVHASATGNQGGSEIALSWEGNGLIAWNDGTSVKARTWDLLYATEPGAPEAITLAPDYSNDKTLTVSWTDSLLGTTPDFTHVELFIFGPLGLVASADVAYPTTSYQLTNLADGTYVAELTAVDDLGHASDTGSSNTAVVDTVAPLLSVALTNGSIGGDSVDMSEHAQIVVAASDERSGIAALTVANQPYTAPFSLPLGTTTLVFTAKDRANNQSTRTITFHVHEVPDPPEDLVFVPEATNGDSLRLEWFPPSQGLTPVGYHVVVKDAGGATIVDTITTATDLVLGGLVAEATLTATVTAIESHALESLPATATGFVDRTPPEVSISGVPAPTPLAPEPSPILDTTRVTLSATDDRSGVAEVRYSVDQGPEVIFTGHFRLAAGSHVVTWYAIDLAGNTSAPDSWSFTVSEAASPDRFCADQALAQMGRYLEVSGPIALFGSDLMIRDFRWDGAAWSLVGTLPIPDKGPSFLGLGQRFGRYDVAGDTLVVSDPADQSCFVSGPDAFICNAPDTTVASGRDRLVLSQRNGTTWTPGATIFPDASGLSRPAPPSIGSGGILFDGSRIVAIAGGHGSTTYLGAAFTFVFSGGAWVQEAAFQPADLLGLNLDNTIGAGFDGVGAALDGDWLYLTGNNGLASQYVDQTYVYHKEGSAWVQKAILPDWASIAAEGDTLVIGFELYQRTINGGTTTFTHVGTLANPFNAQPYHTSHALAGDRLLISVGPWGAVLSYNRVAGVWSLECVNRYRDVAGTGAINRVAFAGDFALVTAPDESDAGLSAAGCGYALVDRLPYDFQCVNTGPSANAGADLTVSADATCGADVMLDGRSSTDPDGDGLVFDWTLLTGPGLGAPTPVPGSGPTPTVRLGAGSWQVGLNVSDGGVTSAQDTLVVHVVDDDAPALVGVPGNATDTCDAISDPAAVSANDNCGADVVLDEARVDVGPGEYRLVRTWTATDAANNATIGTQTVTVLAPPVVDVDDVVSPVAVCRSASVALDADGLATVDADSLDAGSTDACGIATRAASPPTLTCADLGSVDATLIVGDYDGNTGECVAALTVFEDVPPTARCHDPAVVHVDASGSHEVVAADLDDNSHDGCGALTDRVASFPGLAPPPPVVTKLAPAISPWIYNNGLPDTWNRGMATYQGKLYFAAQSATYGTELFRYDGTQVTLAADIIPGTASSEPYWLTVFDGKLYFSAAAQTSGGAALGRELFAYDGTTATLVGDFKAGSVGSYPWGLTVFQGALYMLLADLDESLHRWNGTSMTTVNSSPNAQNVAVAGILGVDGGKLYLNARQWFNGLVTYDGSDFVALASLGQDWVGSFNWPTFYQGKLYGATTLTKGEELYRIDGPGFTELDIYAGANSSTPKYLTVFGGKLYLVAASSQTGGIGTLRVYDGTSITSILGGFPEYLTNAGGYLYFAGNSPQGFELRRYDGSTFGVIDVRPGGDSSPRALFWDGADLFFGAYDGTAYGLHRLHQGAAEAIFDCGDVGTTLPARLTVTDDEGDTAFCDTTVSIQGGGGDIDCLDTSVSITGTSAPLSALDLDGNHGSIAACGGTLSASPTSVACADVGDVVPVTLTYVNGALTKSCTAHVTVADATPPVATCIAASDLVVVAYDNHFAWVKDGVVHVDEAIPGAALDAGSSDNCGIASRTAARGDTGGAPVFDEADVGLDVDLVLTVGDGANSDLCVVPLTVLPLVEARCNADPIELLLDDSGSGTLTVDDVDDGSSTSVGNLLLSLDQTTFECSEAGDQLVTLTAKSDLYDFIASTCQATVHVIGSPHPVANAKDVTVDLDAQGQGSITAADADDGSDLGCGSGTLSVSPETFDCQDLGVQSATLTIVDSLGQTDADDFDVTVRDLVDPDLVSESLTRTLGADGFVAVAPADVLGGSSDNCGIGSLTLSQTDFGCADIGSNQVTATVTDLGDNSVSAPVAITIQEGAPEVRTRAVTLALGAHPPDDLDPAAVDDGSTAACGIASRSLDRTSFGCSDLGTHSVTLTVTSTTGASASATAAVTVADQLDPSPAADDVVVSLDGGGHGSLSAAAIDAGSSDNCGVATTTIDATTFDCSDLGPNSVTLTVQDTSGNQASTTATATVVDPRSPTLSCADVTVTTEPGKCQRTLTRSELVAGLSASDNCSAADGMLAALSAVRSDGQALTAPFPRGTTTVQYTIHDATGNDAHCSQLVKVEDQEQPIIAFDDQTVAAGCGSSSTFQGATATDNCPGVTVTTTPTPGTPLPIGQYVATASATDASGNTATDTAVITVRGGLRVVFQAPLEDDNVADDIDSDADIINRVRVGSVVPNKVKLFDCHDVDVTASLASKVTAWLAVVSTTATNVPRVINDLPPDFHGVGDSGGRMIYVGDHFQFNRDTNAFVAGRFYRSVVWVEANDDPGTVIGVEDALLLAK